jgi:hypothetical protein
MSQLSSEKEEIDQRLSDMDVESRKLEGDLNRFEKLRRESVMAVKQLEQKNPWIEREKQ